MSISVNGQSKVPPGFRFHPTEEELLQYYLRKKVSYEEIDLDVIKDIDLNKLEPWDIQEKCKIGSTPQNDWYFFSHKDRKYPTGTRTNRATTAGFWKATGRDKLINSNSRRIGMRKTLVFYKGRAPHGEKSDWIMHEYRLDVDDNTPATTNVSCGMGETLQEDGWVVCRIFKKKNHYKILHNPINCATETKNRSPINSCDNEGTLEQILEHKGRTSKEEQYEPKIGTDFPKPIRNHHLPDRVMKLSSLERPIFPASQECYQLKDDNDISITNSVYNSETSLNNWAALDCLLASNLTVQSETSKQLASFNDPMMDFGYLTDHDLQHQQLPSLSSLPIEPYPHFPQVYNSEIDLWSFTQSSLSSKDSLYPFSSAPAKQKE